MLPPPQPMTPTVSATLGLLRPSTTSSWNWQAAAAPPLALIGGRTGSGVSMGSVRFTNPCKHHSRILAHAVPSTSISGGSPPPEPPTAREPPVRPQAPASLKPHVPSHSEHLQTNPNPLTQAASLPQQAAERGVGNGKDGGGATCQ